MHSTAQYITQTAAYNGITHAVLSPGSRCAPLTLALNRHGSFQTYMIPDERSAAFVALGMAQKLRQPVMLVCTSGSAVLNYAPALAEAYYRQVPLLVCTADRPPEWIDQRDGQTIRQPDVYHNYIKQSFALPVADTADNSRLLISEAVRQCLQSPQGPVHLNVPLREPLYAEHQDTPEEATNTDAAAMHTPAFPEDKWQQLLQACKQHRRILIAGGQLEHTGELQKFLKVISEQGGIPVAGDIISNLHGHAFVIRHLDIITASPARQKALQPGLLITFGRSFISKNFKLWLRRYQPAEHWHVERIDKVPDPFQSNPKHLSTNPESFLKHLADHVQEFTPDPGYLQTWQQAEAQAALLPEKILQDQPFNEFGAVYQLMQALPADSHLHLANSMPVRYANFIGLTAQQAGVQVFANRGTSGIDGCLSTAAGSSLVSDQPNVLLTGDMAFFYDRNGLWHNHNLANLKIVILNNHGGGIFRMIDGPAEQPELETWFETHQTLKAENTARDFNCNYYYCNSREALQQTLSEFLEAPNTAILEIDTEGRQNQQVFQQFKKQLKA